MKFSLVSGYHNSVTAEYGRPDERGYVRAEYNSPLTNEPRSILVCINGKGENKARRKIAREVYIALEIEAYKSSCERAAIVNIPSAERKARIDTKNKRAADERRIHDSYTPSYPSSSFGRRY